VADEVTKFPVEERWRSVPGWEGFYEASSHGRVRRVAFVLRAPPSAAGYPTVTLSAPGRRRRSHVHQLVALAFMGEPNGRDVNHKDAVKANAHLENLEYVTRQQNIRHAIENGLWDHAGEKNTGAKLTELDVKEIRAMRESGVKIKDLMPMFGVGRSAISQIANRKRWKHCA
jgi:HNH endonuclease/NUMOD4 motif-containing protein